VEIATRQVGDALEVAVSGRLDAYWADHLARALDESIRGGADRVRLDLSGVSFVSSVGLRVLVRFYKQLRGINGTLAVTNPSAAVARVLELAGLEALLARGDATAPGAPSRPVPPSVERGSARFDVFELAREARLRCRVIGAPERLEGARFEPGDCRTVGFPDGTLGLGLGAFGQGFADCQARFGEFLAAGGAAAYLPGDGTNVPDHLVSAGALVPELQVLYALACEGGFATLARFETGAAGPVGLRTLADTALELVAADAAGIVMVAESAGLIGAALRRSPARGPAAGAPFAFPEIREWLSFTPERAHTRSVVLAVGIVARAAPPPLAPLLRPLGGPGAAAGHVHAAAFSYRPLQRGLIDLGPTVTTLFQDEELQGVLHLLPDDRGAGGRESEFVRGACWIGPVGEVVAA
jgi:anti-anti-sigma factor